ncbi:hypothetical protein, partial [Euzebya pacifica]|uniref:hypothetical protein n=1 Tax=Euzebya pacifica TaxID=1608957 RepID=UPI0030FB561C
MRAAFVMAVLALTVTACASTGAVPTAAVVDDAGARTRAEVLSRYTDDGEVVLDVLVEASDPLDRPHDDTVLFRVEVRDEITPYELGGR